jgi:hypothetical protein
MAGEGIEKPLLSKGGDLVLEWPCNRAGSHPVGICFLVAAQSLFETTTSVASLVPTVALAAFASGDRGLSGQPVRFGGSGCPLVTASYPLL